ncbi:MAG: AraC family transcriptional regulator [Verrucomicrobiae bacterium]|nr:AraC family transcriptional regulator [Verrucomicrobiae bacterium]
MKLWCTHIQTLQPLPHFPQLQAIASERRDDPSYRSEGRFRQADMHCIFKYTLSGEGCFSDDAGEHRLPPGHGFLCEIRDRKTAYYYPPDGKKPWEYVFMTFLGSTDWVHDLVSRHGAIYAISQKHPVMQRILAYRQKGTRVLELNANASAEMVTSLLLALAEIHKPDEADNASILTRRVRELVGKQLEENLNATSLARQLKVSREHLSRIFHAQSGQTLYHYILRQKMLLACQLLKETPLSQKEIAARLAFPSAPHFSRTFRRVMLMSPSLFRDVGHVPVA